MSEKIGQDPARRCDAKCYGAQHSKCACICGGRNHGQGLQRAIDNVREIFVPILEERTGLKISKIAAEMLKQRPLFGADAIARTAQGELF